MAIWSRTCLKKHLKRDWNFSIEQVEILEIDFQKMRTLGWFKEKIELAYPGTQNFY